MNKTEKQKRLRFLCAIAARALSDLSAPDKILLYESMALVLPDRPEAEKAEFTAFALAKSESAQQEMDTILRAL